MKSVVSVMFLPCLEICGGGFVKNDIERSFEDIPEDKNSEARQTAYLTELGWHGGLNWADLLQSKRILIISEAGAGKTYECRNQQQRLWEAGEPAFYIELADLARDNLRDLLSSHEASRFDAWHSSQSDLATFFLDSIDELQLSLGSFEQSLKRLERAAAGQLGRVRIIITSRPIPIDEQLFHKILPVPPEPQKVANSEEFAKIAMAQRGSQSPPKNSSRDWRSVALLPLSETHIRQISTIEGVEDPDALVSAIRKRHAEEFVRRPQDLIELCADWREHKRIRSHRDQVATNITVKLKPREDRREIAPLSVERAKEGACRLAIAAILCRKLTIRHSAKADRGGDPSEAPLDPSVILYDWPEDERRTLLERSLFGFASYGRVRFHHRSVMEYLAAEYLISRREKGMTARTISRTLFATTPQGVEVIKPSLRSVVAWMALRDDEIFEQALRREPEVLLNMGDPESMSPLHRQKALRSYVERHGAGGWRGLRVPRIQLHRLAASDLGPEVKRLWEQGVENPEVRETLLELMGQGKLYECADIAHGIATDIVAPHRERVDALDSLIQLSDPRLATISSSVAGEPKSWPNQLAKSILIRLFPEHMTVDLLCKALSRITEKRGSVGEISWNLSRLVQHVRLPHAELVDLRLRIEDLVLEGVVWSENRWPHLKSKRPFLVPVLAALCLRQLEASDRAPSLMLTIAAALRLAGRDHETADPVKKLKESLIDLASDARRCMFEADDAFLQRYKRVSDPYDRFCRLAYYGATMALGSRDATWILPSLSDRRISADDRAMLLEAAIRIRDDNASWVDHIRSLREAVTDLPDLSARLDELSKLPARNPNQIRWERRDAERKKHEERREAKAHASWVMFWRELVKNSEAAFASDRSANTAWGLWQAMERSGEESQSSGWNRRFIERHFGTGVADKLRLAVMTFWRNDKPTLRSERPDEEKNSYLRRWSLGLAGIYAEAEDPRWVESLTSDEARLALRYISVDFTGFPAWLTDFLGTRSVEVNNVLGEELAKELAEPPTSHSSILQSIKHSSPSIASVFIPRLLEWLEDGCWKTGHHENEPGQSDRLREVIAILIQNGNSEVLSKLRILAKFELKDGVTDKVSGVWLPALMRLDAAAGVDVLEKTVRANPPAKYGPAIGWFSSLFGDPRREGETCLTTTGLTPDLLFRLAHLAYEHVRPSDDQIREGSFTPNDRDDAERGRGNILNALLSTSGADGWSIKLRLADDPIFADFRDRALAMARERAAEEADAGAFTENDVLALDRAGDLPALTRDEIFVLMSDRLDDIEDALLRDDSPRAAWALVQEERIMRQLIARELRSAARGAYTVDQEAVTADEKETDIRLRSTGSAHEAVIELKIGEKDRSAADLMATIKGQLVAKYMASENSRSGCLLITLSSARRWQHPDTGEALALDGLIELLNEEAKRVEKELGGSLRLIVRGLNLNPRLSTERAQRR
ncbi:NACHT domain-containing protein [Agrobacterium rosae]|uniref:NACHT domain-containing protein n=1 Tax=Agrobacterium rosae TaxID=1972867 RepID=UPI0020340D5A|nr:hypothetical protein [Agrobacterium rosae]MCM2435841.1 ATP-binding protein [Agrobacterium rosae]